MVFDWNNERPDMQLERDRSHGTIRDNVAAEQNKPIPDQPFASEGEGFKISEIVKKLAQKGGGSALYYNHQIEWNMELAEAAQEVTLNAITPDGWDSPLTGLEQINAHGHAPGMHEYEITVEIFE